MVVTIIVLLLLVILLSWIAIVQYLRCSKLELITNNVVANMQSISDIISDTSSVLNNDQLAVAFSNDDEVGAFFTQIKNIQDILDKFVIRDNGKEIDKQQ